MQQAGGRQLNSKAEQETAEQNSVVLTFKCIVFCLQPLKKTTKFNWGSNGNVLLEIHSERTRFYFCFKKQWPFPKDLLELHLFVELMFFLPCFQVKYVVFIGCVPQQRGYCIFGYTQCRNQSHLLLTQFIFSGKKLNWFT